jgi:hypothetical protein
LRPEKGTAEAKVRAVYSNKILLFGPAAWGGQNFCDREQDICTARARDRAEYFASVVSILPHDVKG